MIELVAATHRTIAADQRRPGQCHVADRIDRLVTDEFVGETYALGIEDAVFGDHDRVLERSAERIARTPELGYIAHETKGAGAGQFTAKHRRLDIECISLAADNRMIKFDFGLDAQTARIWKQFAKRAVLADANGLEHLD